MRDELTKARYLLYAAMGAVSSAFGVMNEEVLPRGQGLMDLSAKKLRFLRATHQLQVEEVTSGRRLEEELTASGEARAKVEWLQAVLAMARLDEESAWELEQHTLLVAAEMALVAEVVKEDAQERATLEVDLEAKWAHWAEETTVCIAALEHSAQKVEIVCTAAE